TEAMATDVYHVIDASHDPKITIAVAPRAISGKVNVFNLRPILFAVSFVITPNSPQHRRPRPLDNEITALVGAHRIAVAGHHISIDSGKGLCRRTGFCRRGAGKGSDHDGSSLGLPPGVDDRTYTAPNNLVIPNPCFGINGLAHRTQQTKAGEIMFERPLFTPFDEGAYCRRGRIQN